MVKTKTNLTDTPQKIFCFAIARLKKMASREKARAAQAYFKETVKCFGVSAPEVRNLARELYSSVKDSWQLEEAVELCELLLQRPELEAKGLGTVLLEKFKRQFRPSLLRKIKSWLQSDYLDNWASTDIFSTSVVSTLLLTYPELIDEVKGWVSAENRWLQRASAVSFIKLAKKYEHLADIYEISDALFPSKDDLIQKANGWLLREAGKTDPERLKKFLLARGPSIPRTTLRYAIERFPENQRKRILLSTRIF